MQATTDNGRNATAEDECRSCPVCGAGGFETFFTVERLPSLSCALWPTAEAARACPRGTIALAGCRSCGFIANADFDPSLTEYDATYENALHFSAVFRAYAEREAEHLIERYRLRGKRIVEIGCGDGQFLSALCRLGGNTGDGYDPSFVPDNHAPPLDSGVRIEPRYYTEADAAQAPDLILCRQVLEHIPDPTGFLRMIRAGLGGRTRTVLSFEVPNADYLIADLSVWDLIYEHCTYFTAPALQSLFAGAGFDVREVRTGFGGLNLLIEAVPAKGAGTTMPTDLSAEIEAVAARIDAFRGRAAARIALWSARLQGWRGEGRRVCLWGAGARSAMFLSMVGRPDAVGAVVDINPRKHGAFLPGTGHRIDAPAGLPAFAPDIVLLMNPNYRQEVGEMLASLGLAAELVVP
ncbi:MAG: methyltransferase domain-containing protein [Rhodospirillaceae bacterium]|nr:methyltransferase domain-containing protein [Rhodospirillaceae bacterium]